MNTIFLLVCSNVFMTVAWYGHLRYKDVPLWKAILASWLIAFVEYCFQVPANRWGHGIFDAYQLKIIQEIITLGVFIVFATCYLKEQLRWNHATAMALIIAAAYFAFMPTGANAAK